MPLRVAVCISGRGSNLEALLRSLGPTDGVSVVLVISNRADAGGLAVARDHDVPTAVVANTATADDWLRVLEAHRVDFVVLAGFLRKVPAEVIAQYRGRLINVHPALLPDHGGPGMYGLNVHRAVLARGDLESGATVHGVTEQYDEGPILGQARVPVRPDDTPEALAARVLAVEHRLLPAAVRAAARTGRAVPFTLND